MSKKAIALLMAGCMVGSMVAPAGTVMAQESDLSGTKITFLNTKTEIQDYLEDMGAAFKEETGITLLNPILKGIEEFKTKDEDRYFIFFYVASEYLGEISSNSEGEVFWIDEKDIFNYELSLDLDRILKVMEDDDISALRYYKENNEWKSVLE